MLILAAWYHVILATIFSTLAVLLMLVILLQRGRGVGLSGAFGAAGGHSALGSKTGDILTWITMVGAGVFLVLAIGLNCVFRPSVTITPPPPEVDRSGPLEPAPAPAANPMPQTPAPVPASPTPPAPTSQPASAGGPQNTTPSDQASAPPAFPAPSIASLIWPPAAIA